MSIPRTLAVCAVCLVYMLHTAQAMYGLCSTDWLTDGCFDNNKECHDMGGTCQHPGVGDHGEGCVCLKQVFRDDHWEYQTLMKDHFKEKGRLSYNINNGKGLLPLLMNNNNNDNNNNNNINNNKPTLQ